MKKLEKAVFRWAVASCLSFAGFLSWGAEGAWPVAVSWLPIPGASSYEVQVSGETSENYSTQTIRSLHTSLNLDLPTGRCEYRIRGFDEKGRPGPWSAPSFVVVAPRRIYVGMGVAAGTNYAFPAGEFEYRLNGAFSLGLALSYANSAEVLTHLQSFGAFLSPVLSLSHSDSAGFSLAGGIGGYYLSEPELGEHATVPAIFFLGQWRWRIVDRFSVTLGAGGQWIGNPNKDPNRWIVAYSGLLPLVRAAVGYQF